ncbi:MAG: aspartate--tRNA ligase [Anaerolineae bacterium]|nr:aspartate--tRNA ligase [Anaerolineae bacterium]MDW8173046.1 aspartate--tRNA ligase [Anaerolineae bacterium]
MMKSHTCGELRDSHAGQRVTLAGWVNNYRDQGGVIFLDLRDRWGITQIVANRETHPQAHAVADKARSEYVVQVKGVVRQRPQGSENPNLTTGSIEVVAEEVKILAAAKTPPFYINRDDEKIDESLRMKHRYLDLRRPKMQRNLVLRHRAIKFIRDYLDARGFIEVETPILFKTTPEGARDFLVPSRLQPGKFYALPQSPQQLKQLLMVAGVEKYFQIARCFRDEDLRGQRQPEFTQLDLEMSFVEREDVMQLNEALMTALVKEVAPEKRLLAEPFPRLLYKDAMELYGSDKPDLRFDCRAMDISDLAAKSSFPVFVNNVAEGKPVKVIRAPKVVTAEVSKTRVKQIGAELEAIAKAQGAKGLAWIAVPLDETEELQGPIAKYFSVEQKAELFERTQAGPGDMLLFISDKRQIVYDVTDALRQHLGKMLNLIDPDLLALAWVIDFPMFLWDEENQRWDPSQHMFTMPMPEDLPLLDTDPGAARGSQYDMICNGYEVAGGSIRIYDRDLQAKIFPLIGQQMDHAMEQFGHILEAFEYGVPPHGGIAWGIDRVVAVLANEPNIREVIAFPKTQNGSDLMAHCPSEPDPRQLEELFVRVELPQED